MACSGGALQEAPAPLCHDEQASIGFMAPARLAEFSQGRQHARTALAQLGLADASIPMAADRSPVWPPGFVGSISHVPADRVSNQPGQVLAVVARARDCAGLGVDLERTGRLMPEHWPAFMSAAERAWLALRPAGQRSPLAHGLWSAKEAVMKALVRPMDPHAIDIRVLGDGRAFVAEWRGPQAGDVAEAAGLSGWLTFGNGWVLALATLQTPQTRPAARAG